MKNQFPPGFNTEKLEELVEKYDIDPPPGQPHPHFKRVSDRVIFIPSALSQYVECLTDERYTKNIMEDVGLVDCTLS